MKKTRFFIVGLFVCALLLPAAVFGHEEFDRARIGNGTGIEPGGFTGPRSALAQAQRVTVTEAAALKNDTLVILQGTIVVSLGKEKYTFRDASGEITVDIDRKLWRGLSVSETDTVEISGKVEKGVFRETKIEVKILTKI